MDKQIPIIYKENERLDIEKACDIIALKKSAFIRSCSVKEARKILKENSLEASLNWDLILMESLADWMEENLGKIIIIYDLQGRRYEGELQRVFADFFQIFESHQRLNKVFRFSSIKDFSLKGVQK